MTVPGILRTAKPRTRKCKVCRTPFVPRNSMVDKWCSPECGASLGLRLLSAKKKEEERARKKQERAERAAAKQALEKHKPLEYFLKIAERHCNEYIRARDPDECISCGVTHSSAWQAGHYISVGANKTLRFDEDNIHKQCIQCNMFKGSNATEYRPRLVAKIGLERVERLESWHSPIKMTRDAAQEIAEHYKAKLKALQQNKQLKVA